jgi:hypothetical protein
MPFVLLLRTIAAVLGMSITLSRAMTPVATAATDEFIWQDRWRNAGWAFQYGYAVGINDLLFVLVDRGSDQGLEKMIAGVRSAHLCLHTATIDTIKAASDFTDRAVAPTDVARLSRGVFVCRARRLRS